MRDVCRLLIRAEQQRLNLAWLLPEAVLERSFRESGRTSMIAENRTASAAPCTRPATPGHHSADSSARLTPVKALRDAPTPLRGADGLDRGSVEPCSGIHVMARRSADLALPSPTRFQRPCRGGVRGKSRRQTSGVHARGADEQHGPDSGQDCER